MKRILLSLVVSTIIAMLSTGLHAQTLPIAAGAEWSYVNSDRADTIRVRITGKAALRVSCRKGTEALTAWIDNQRYAYLTIGNGIVVAERRVLESGDSVAVPLFYLPNNLKKGVVPPPLRQECAGTYSFIGFAMVSTPAGAFDGCLIFDDRSVHRVYVAPGIGIVKEERYGKGPDEGTAAERTIISTRLLVNYTPNPPHTR
jgi:hypothetical protein